MSEVVTSNGQENGDSNGQEIQIRGDIYIYKHIYIYIDTAV